MRVNGYIEVNNLKNIIKTHGHYYQLEMRAGEERWYLVIAPDDTYVCMQGNENVFHVNGDIYHIDGKGIFISHDSQGYIPDRTVSSVKELTVKEYEYIDRMYSNMFNELKRSEEQIRTYYQVAIKP